MYIIGHRGAKGLAPENTLASFAKAIELGVPEIECDVRVTADGIPVLEHDARLETPGINTHVVSKHTLAELQTYRPDLPTMAEAIEFTARRAIIQFELKPKESIEPIIDCIKTYLAKGWNEQDFLVSSRDVRLLRRVKQQVPGVPLGIVQPWSSILAVWHARKLGTKRISMNEHALWPPVIRGLSQRGFDLCGYSMNDPKRAAKWARHGLFAVITDYPDRFTALKSDPKSDK